MQRVIAPHYALHCVQPCPVDEYRYEPRTGSYPGPGMITLVRRQDATLGNQHEPSRLAAH